ncbi:MAG: pyrroline-5-carboxylate reductase [Candidatus Omnitrophica bacterium]|nr:pyrroline-5-carboxylate reductase [Candidatus Omnitrophota bacterium]
MLKLGIIGGGNMGTAIISRTFKKYKITVCERDPMRAALLKKKYRTGSSDLAGVAGSSNVIILAVKPQDMESVLAELKGSLKPKTLVISIAAGLTTRFFEKHLGRKVRVIRAMPNMPAQIGAGMTAICKGKSATGSDLAAAVKIFSKIGEHIIVEERMMDAVTAVSGSGPAYLFLFAECFYKAALKTGLEPNVAKKLVECTMAGSMYLFAKSEESAESLRLKVTSKGGTTQAALDVFLDNNFEKMFVDAVRAAQLRAKQLAK